MTDTKTIFITGAASGIGRATAKLFAERGWFVGLYDLDEKGLAALRIETGTSKTCMGVLDVASLDDFKRNVDDFARTTGGRMDVLFNCAGILRMGRFEHIPPEQAHQQIQVNLVGVVNGVYASLPLLEKTEGATILNMSSASAIYGTPELAVYSATKFAVRALTEALDLELRRKDIRVADIMPSYVATPMVHNQKYRAKSLETVGVNLKAEHIAEVAWRAVNGKKGVHHLLRPELKLFVRLAGFESLARQTMRYLSKM
ncbi:MAG TPA: SDR family oxidoreductase [Polyangiaceae bacterium]|nr:SDR family oxidoreductase [Polyangiaceae bacterium]